MGRLLINGKPPLARANIHPRLWADNKWRYKTKELALALIRTMSIEKYGPGSRIMLYSGATSFINNEAKTKPYINATMDIYKEFGDGYPNTIAVNEAALMVALAEGVRTLLSRYKSKQCEAASAELEAAVDRFKLEVNGFKLHIEDFLSWVLEISNINSKLVIGFIE
ncbi:hypothetical protein V2W45_1331576 [Cenococcum geophilum]